MDSPSVWARIRGFFASTEELDAAAEEQREREEHARIERLARSPIHFPSEGAWLDFRARHGYSTRPRRRSTWWRRARL